MRIFGGMEHLTPRRSGRSKNDAAAGATDRKKEGRGVKEGGEIEGVEQPLSYLYSDAEPVHSLPAKFHLVYIFCRFRRIA